MKKMILLLLASLAFGKEKPDPRLKDIHSLFVSGNNQAAEQVRKEMQKDSDKGKGCFVLATNPKDADATLDLASDASHGDLARDWIVSGTLTTKAGDQLWSHSERFSDAPFTSGGKTAGKLLYSRLKLEACSEHK